MLWPNGELWNRKSLNLTKKRESIFDLQKVYKFLTHLGIFIKKLDKILLNMTIFEVSEKSWQISAVSENSCKCVSLWLRDIPH
jgi:hypothetical protein